MRKWYRSLIEHSGDPRGEILVGGAYPGEVFMFDYDRPGFHEAPLLENGVIEALGKEPSKEELSAVARRKGIAGTEALNKEDIIAMLEETWEG